MGERIELINDARPQKSKSHPRVFFHDCTHYKHQKLMKCNFSAFITEEKVKEVSQTASQDGKCKLVITEEQMRALKTDLNVYFGSTGVFGGLFTSFSVFSFCQGGLGGCLLGCILSLFALCCWIWFANAWQDRC